MFKIRTQGNKPNHSWEFLLIESDEYKEYPKHFNDYLVDNKEVVVWIATRLAQIYPCSHCKVLPGSTQNNECV